MIKNSPKQLTILGVEVSVTSRGEVLKFVADSLKNKSKFFITTPNPEIIVAAQKDDELMTALNSADVALPDGVGLGINPRITGREMFESLLSTANRLQLRVYLLGATPEVNRLAIAKIKILYPRIKAKGNGDIKVNSKGYSVSERDRGVYIDIIRDINSFRPNILFVAFGAPKQEKWVYHNLKKLNIGGAMVVGGALDYFVGKAKLPPGFVSTMGLEWLWRGVREPRRIKRIFNAVVVFPLLVIKEKLWKA